MASWLFKLLITYIRSAPVTSHVYALQFISMPNKNYVRKQCDELSTVQSDITLPNLLYVSTFHHNKHNYNVSEIDDDNNIVVAFTHLIVINVFM